MIESFADDDTKQLWESGKSRRFSAIAQVAIRKLVMIDAAVKIDDLRIPPGNRLEALKGDRKGQFSIRINDQWRLCLEFSNGRASKVEIVDYH